ncbi:CobW family GTP-binding protein [Shewanella gaetbuli]
MIIRPVNTNVITGFLGVGKTTLIKQLLAYKPEGEVWAVLVNEFGEIGIDAGLINDTPDNSITIKEVAGGCLCCAAGVPIQVAINQIIQQAKPDRLLIEPTGIGHPKQIIATLTSEHYVNVVNLQGSVCVVDARKIDDERYITHDTYLQQLMVADLVVAAKAELYQPHHLPKLAAFLAQHSFTPEILVGSQFFQSTHFVEQLLAKLAKPTEKPQQKNVMTLQPATPNFIAHSRHQKVQQGFVESEHQPIELGEVVCKTNKGEGCHSVGWLICPSKTFDLSKILEWLKQFTGSSVLRVKAIVITHEGILAANFVDGEFTFSELDDTLDSRIEIISEQVLDQTELQASLLNCKL